MGIVSHNAIIVTCDGVDDARDMLWDAHKKAEELFEELVTPIVSSEANQHRSFFIAPDGWYDGRSGSNEYDKKREEYMNYLDTLRYEGGKQPYSICRCKVYGESRG